MSETAVYVVEPMTLDDLDQVMEIEHLAFPAPWSVRAYRFELTENEQSTMLVVRPAISRPGLLAALAQRLRDSRLPRVLGYGGFWLLVDEAHICTIAVHPEWRGRGLGELLLLSLLQRGQRLGACRATLEVRVSNLSALGLYHKVGFQIVSLQKRYYADNQEDAYIMATPPFNSIEFQELLKRHRVRLATRLGRGLFPGATASPEGTDRRTENS